MTTAENSNNACQQARAAGLRSRSFLGLLVTQMLGATNDNIFRWLAIGVGKQFVGRDEVAFVLTAGTACFVVPYLVLAAPAGYLADRFSKRNVIVGCKAAEIVIMTLGLAAIWSQSLTALFIVVALMGAQSALFAPSKLGSIPEMLRVNRISAANGLIGLTTVVAVVIGTAIGNVLSDMMRPDMAGGMHNLPLCAAVLIGVAVTGWLTSLLIVHLPVANPTRRFPWDAPQQSWRDLRLLGSSRSLLRVALGLAFFWSLGTLANLNIDQFGFEGGVTQQKQNIPLLMSLVVGVGAGSVLAGVWSGGRVELGILPLGAAGIALSSMLLFTVQGTLVDPTTAWTAGYVWACVLLAMLGISAGLFDVPLAAYMQDRSPPESRGAILAASNLITFATILAASLLFSGLRMHVHEGSLENIAQLQQVDMSADAQRAVATTVDRFSADRGQADPPPIEHYLEQAGGDVPRDVLLAELLLAEWTAAEGPKLTPQLRSDTLARFADDEPLVRAVFDEASGHPLFTARHIFLMCGVFTVPVFLYVVFLVPQAFVRFVVWLASQLAYRIRVHGLDNLPDQGGALLVPNHVSWLDGVLLMLVSSRPIRMVVWAGNFQTWWLRRLVPVFGAILITNRPKEIAKALKEARQALRDGDLVCIFPEGGISRSGHLQTFKPGILKVLQGTETSVVPVYLDELWGSIFSFEGGKFFWKWPRHWPYPVSIHVGKPIAPPHTVHSVRLAVQSLGAEAVQQRQKQSTSLPIAMLRTCKRQRRAWKVADTSGAQLTGGDLLMRSFILRRLLRRGVLATDEQFVGLLLPPSVGGVVANAALTLDRRTTVNLNYTVSSEVLNECVAQAGIRHVLTSRKFMEKVELDLDVELVYLEDFKDRVTLSDKLAAAAMSALPTGVIGRLLGLNRIGLDDVATIIFTSGSTGIPKGVMLTHGNIASNCEGIEQVIQLNENDVVVGILPFFHSFGFTITLWGTLTLGIRGAYHFNPLDARQVGKMCAKHGCTLLVSTPTFLRSFTRRCEREQFATLDVVVTGAEKLHASVADAFEQKFGVRPIEGYGATETSPVTSCNIPASRSPDTSQITRKEGSVGRPFPGVSAKVVDLDTGGTLDAGQSGMLLVRGPNIMAGYLNMADKTAEVLKDGWYTTGDIAVIDDDGFIFITGRQSRFSKIGGEMVPHIKIEETLSRIIDDDDQHDDDDDSAGLKVAVTALPDQRKGERLVVLHTSTEQTPDQLRKALAEAGLPNIFIPSADSFVQVDQLPLLGTGKLDLRAVRQLAEEKLT